MAPTHGSYTFETDQRHGYHTYVPNPLQRINKINIDDELLSILIKTNYLLGKLDGMFSYIPDVNILIYPLAHYEAVCSCNIEKQESLLNERYGAEPRKISDEDAIRAYQDILLNESSKSSQERVLTSILRNMHKQFLGDENEAGQFRKSQIFTYPQTRTSTAPQRFNPQNPHEAVTALEELDNYAVSPRDYAPIIQVALIYYQLCIVQPFLSENGTTTRACVNRLLVQNELISYPVLCFSEFMSLFDAEFRDFLRLVRDGWRDYETWISFFLRVVVNAAEKTITILSRLHQLRAYDLEKLQNSKKYSPLLSTLYEHLWKSPVIETRRIASVLGVSYNTAAKAVDTLCYLGILEQTDSNIRYRKFGYERLRSIFT